MRHDPVEDERHAGREEEPEAPGGCDEAEVEVLRVPLLPERGIEECAQGDNGDPGGSGEGGEQGAGAEGHDRQPPRHPAQERPREPHEPPGRAALAEKAAGKGEQGDAQEHRGVDHPVDFDDRRHGVEVEPMEAEQGARGDDREQGRPKQGEEDEGRTGYDQHGLLPIPALSLAPADRVDQARAGEAYKANRYQREGQGEDDLGDPDRDGTEELGPVSEFFAHECEGGPGEQGAHARGEGVGDDPCGGPGPRG